MVVGMMGVKSVLSSNCKYKYDGEVRVCSGSSDWILTKYGDNEVNIILTKIKTRQYILLGCPVSTGLQVWALA